MLKDVNRAKYKKNVDFIQTDKHVKLKNRVK